MSHAENPYGSIIKTPGVENIAQAFDSLTKARRLISSGALEIDAPFDVRGLEIYTSMTLVDLCKLLGTMKAFEQTLLTVKRKLTLPEQYDKLADKIILRNEKTRRDRATLKQAERRAAIAAFNTAQHETVIAVPLK